MNNRYRFYPLIVTLIGVLSGLLLSPVAKAVRSVIREIGQPVIPVISEIALKYYHWPYLIALIGAVTTLAALRKSGANAWVVPVSFAAMTVSSLLMVLTLVAYAMPLTVWYGPLLEMPPRQDQTNAEQSVAPLPRAPEGHSEGAR